MSGKKTEAVETLPADIRHSTFDIRQSSALPHNRYHRAARSSAAMAIVYAAMAGRELIECRKKIKHGGWEKWVDANCEFSVDTAIRYAGLYVGLKEKLSNTAHVRDLMESADAARLQHLVTLLDRPPSELLPEETETLLTDLREATKGETLRQLYFDFGLASLPKPTGGANHLHSFLKQAYPDHPEYLKMALRELPKEVVKAWEKHNREEKPTQEDQHRRCYDIWRRLIRELRDQGLDQKSYAFLSQDELEEIYGTLIDLQKALKEVLKK